MPNPEAGRSISRGEHEEQIEALRARMATAEAKALYRLRSQRVELVNADGKQHRKLRRFSGRGLTPVRCQVGLVVLAHNTGDASFGGAEGPGGRRKPARGCHIKAGRSLNGASACRPAVHGGADCTPKPRGTPLTTDPC